MKQIQWRRGRNVRLALLAQTSPEVYGGFEILSEVEGELGVFLWNVSRSVELWLETEASERGSLFGAAVARAYRWDAREARTPKELRDALSVIFQMMATPGRVAGVRVAEAMFAVSQWAAGSQFVEVALQYGSLAARADSQRWLYAGEVARLLRESGQFERAQLWYELAMRIARASKDVEGQVRVYVGMGVMARHRGALPLAVRLFEKAHRKASRASLRHWRGASAHELMVCAVTSSRFDEGERWAEEAVLYYAPDHPSTRRVIHDVAYSWMVRGEFARAYEVFEQLSDFEVDTKPRGVGTRARAAAGMGAADLYDAAVSEFWSLNAQGLNLLGGLGEIAYGAGQLGRWEEAIELWTRCLDLANEMGATKKQWESRAALEAARRHQQVERNVQVRSEESERRAEQLMGTFARVLEEVASAA